MNVNDTLNEIDAILQVAARNGEIHDKWRDEIELRVLQLREILMPTLNQRQVEIIEALYGLNLSLARGSDDDRRVLTRKIAEQFVFEFGPDYGCKSSTPTNPQSKDAIAKRENNRLYSWDWQNGTTREPQVKVGSVAEDITGQFFIAVTGINHLADEPPVDNGGNTTEVTALVKKVIEMQQNISNAQVQILDAQTHILQILQTILDKPIEIPPVQFPDYESNRIPILGTITFKPKK